MNSVLQVLELTAVFEVISRFQLDVPVQCLLYVRHHLLYIRVTHIDTDDDTAFRSVAVDLERPADEVYARYFSDRNLDSFGSAHK